MPCVAARSVWRKFAAAMSFPVEEFLAWQRAIDTHGVAGLRVTRLQIYRDTPPARLTKPRF